MTSKIEQILEFLKSKPGDGFLTHALALEYIKLGEKQKARNTFETLLSQKPDYVGSYYHLAGLIAEEGDVETALSWYEKGIEAARKSGDMHTLRELQNALNELLY
jgi:tetratricopeptide (TPR) repeat protein